MKIKKIIVAFLVSLLMICNIAPVYADVPYESYTYSKRDTYKAPHSYVPRTVIDGKALGTTPLISPKGMFVSKETIYIADTGNNRILLINSDFTLKGVIDSFQNGGKTDTFNLPEDVFVNNEGTIYIADTENKRIVILNSDKTLHKVITKPKTDLLSEDVQFKPLKLVSSGMGNIYAVIQHVNSGVVELDKDGNFKTFFGANKTKDNKWQYIKKLLSNKQQRESMELNVPTNYNNLSIDNVGFIYVTTDAFDIKEFIDAVMNSGSDDSGADAKAMAPVRRLNLTGTDVLKRTKGNTPIGDLAFMVGNSSVAGASQIVDVHVSDQGIFSILDKNKCRVFAYDTESNMLYMFGGKGSSVGNMLTPSALDKIGKYMLVLDSSMNNITVYSPTEYGDSIQEAINYYYNGQYEKSSEKWNKCLTYNATYGLAYEGLAKAAYRSEDYEKSMQYFKIAEDKDGYSKSFREERRLMAIMYFSIFAGAVIILVLLFFIYKYLTRRKR